MIWLWNETIFQYNFKAIHMDKLVIFIRAWSIYKQRNYEHKIETHSEKTQWKYPREENNTHFSLTDAEFINEKLN